MGEESKGEAGVLRCERGEKSLAGKKRISGETGAMNAGHGGRWMEASLQHLHSGGERRPAARWPAAVQGRGAPHTSLAM